MTSEVEQGSTLVTADYGQHRRQWIKKTQENQRTRERFPSFLRVPSAEKKGHTYLIIQSHGNEGKFSDHFHPS